MCLDVDLTGGRRAGFGVGRDEKGDAKGRGGGFNYFMTESQVRVGRMGRGEVSDKILNKKIPEIRLHRIRGG